MDRIYVKRSKKALENIKEIISAESMPLSSRKKASVKSFGKSAVFSMADPAGNTGTGGEEKTVFGLEAGLKDSSIDITHLEQYITQQASDNPLASTHESVDRSDGELPASVLPDISRILTSESLEGFDRDECLYNNYFDEIRGNVIRPPRSDCMYARPVDGDDVTAISNGTFEGQREERIVIHYSDAIRNVISNPFAGQNLSGGAALSMWVLYPFKDSNRTNRGLLLFADDYKEYPHPAANNSRTLKTTQVLYIDTGLNIRFDGAFQNKYRKKTDFRLRRADRNWMFLTFSFTDEGITVYLNGEKVPYTEETCGKRFNKGEEAGSNKSNVLLTEYLAQEDTRIFLAATLFNDGETSDDICFDDITFYSGAVPDDDAARELYQEALTINLP